VSSQISGTDFTSGTTQYSLPSAPSGPNYAGMMNETNAGLGADGVTGTFNTSVTSTTGEETAPKDEQSAVNKYLESLQAAKEKAPTQEELYSKALEQSGLEEARTRMNNTQNQINSITAKMNQDLLSLRGVGSAEGVTEAVYGGQQSQISREATIRLLPLQAQLAADQGNYEAAQENTNLLFNIYSKDAQNSLDFYEKQAQVIYQDASAKEKEKLDDNRTQKAFMNDLIKLEINNQNDFAQQFAKDGNWAAYRAITSIRPPTNVNSSTFMQDFANYKKDLGSTAQNYGVSTQTVGDSASSIVNALFNVNAGSAEGQQKRDQAKVMQLVANGDIRAAKALIMSRVTSKMSSGERDAQLDRRNTIEALEDMKESLNDYVVATGDTNIIKGGIEGLANKIGTTSDPRLAAIKTRVIQATQKYRNAITGAAWGEQEDAEYKTIFPSISNTNKLNQTIIDTMIPTLKGNERNAISLFLGGSDIYDEVFGQTPESVSAGVETVDVTPDDNEIFNSVIGGGVSTNSSYQQTRDDILYGRNINIPLFNFFK
jgi:hypothetical protein